MFLFPAHVHPLGILRNELVLMVHSLLIMHCPSYQRPAKKRDCYDQRGWQPYRCRLCQRIPEEWTPFTYKGMEFYRVPLPAGSHPASSVGTFRCSEIPKEWTPFTYQGRRFFRIPLQPGSQAAAR